MRIRTLSSSYDGRQGVIGLFLGILLVGIRAAGHRVPEFAWYFSDRGAAYGRGTVRKKKA